MTDIGDRIDADFYSPGATIHPSDRVSNRDVLRTINRLIDLLEKVIEQNGIKP